MKNKEITEFDISQYVINNEIIPNIKDGDKVRINHRYTSTVVGTINDGNKKLIIIKDYNKPLKRYDYQVMEINIFSYILALYMKIYKGKFGTGKNKTEKEINDYGKEIRKKIEEANDKEIQTLS